MSWSPPRPCRWRSSWPAAPRPSRPPRSGRRSPASSRRGASPKAPSSTQGQTLYEIDPSLYRAAAAQAQANLANAQATREAAEAKAARYQAAGRHRGGQQAGLHRRRGRREPGRRRRRAEQGRARDRHGSTCASPGCRRRSPAASAARWSTTGALVTAGQTDPLTTIQRLDPIFVDIQQSSADLRRAAPRAVGRRRDAARRRRCRLILEDGSDYPLAGHAVEFAEAVVDQNTGTVTLRATLPQSDGPAAAGHVRARRGSSQATAQHAILAPQQARLARPAGQRHGHAWSDPATGRCCGPSPPTARSATSGWSPAGLEAGDKLIVEGLQQAQARPAGAGRCPAGSASRAGRQPAASSGRWPTSR